MKIITKTEKEITFEMLQEAAKNHTLKDLLKSGDQIPVTLKSGESVVYTVGHDKTGKTFLFQEDCLDETRPMNKKNTNAGGWKASDMRKWLNATFFALLPDELQAIIIPRKVVQILNGERVETEDKVFLPSKTQLFGDGPWSEREPEDSQIDIFKTEKSRVKECGDSGTYWYWTSSPYYGNTNTFCNVNYTGYANNDNATYSSGVAPGFCISES